MAVRTFVDPVKSFIITEIGARATADCFTNDQLFSYRDPSVDSRLPDIQQPGLRGFCYVYHFQQGREQLIETLARILGSILSSESISEHLIHDERLWTLPQIEDVAARQNQGPSDDVGLCSNIANLFPVIDITGACSFVHLARPSSSLYQKWGTRVVKLGLADIVHPEGEIRLFLRSL